MTGMTIRVQLDNGNIGNRDIAECSDDELRRFVESRREDDQGWQWVVGLARFIRDHAVMLREDCRMCGGTGFVGSGGEGCPVCINPQKIDEGSYIVWDGPTKFYQCSSLVEAFQKKADFGGIVYEPLGLSAAKRIHAESEAPPG